MKSRRGFLAAVLLLLALPVAVLGQVLFGADSETVVHLVGALGFVLLAPAFFDFALPRWVAWAGGVAAAAMAAIFALQALGTVIPDETLHHFAFQVLGSLPEGIALGALLACLLAVCLLESRGATRILGLLTLLAAVAAHVYLISLPLAGTPANAGLKLLYLLPPVWLLLESRKARSLEAPAWRAQVV
jgi:hypothetical protein